MDKTWTVDRNFLFSGYTSLSRFQKAWMNKMESILEAAGWTCLGYGGGRFSGVYSFNASGVTFPGFADDGNTGFWICMRGPDNGDSRPRPEIIYRNVYSTGRMNFFIAPDGGYSGGDEWTIPGTAGAVLNRDNTTDLDWVRNDTNDVRWTFAYSSDGSYIAYSYARSTGSGLSMMVKCLEVDDADDYPYIGFHRTSASFQMIDRWQISYQNGNASLMGMHPTLGDIWGSNGAGGNGYGGTEPKVGGTTLKPGLDPVSGEPTLSRVWVVSWGATQGHVKGHIPDFFLAGMSNTDRFNSGDLTQCGHYALPWGSNSETLLP